MMMGRQELDELVADDPDFLWVLDPGFDPDEVAKWAASADFGSGIVTTVGEIEIDRLSRDGRLDLLVALERTRAHVDAQQQRLLVAIATDPKYSLVESRQQNYVREEVAAALHLSPRTADDRMVVAETLVEYLPRTLAMLESGEISMQHAHVIADGVDSLDDPADIAALETAALARAAKQTRTELARTVARALVRLDAARPRDKKGPPPEDERRVIVRPADYPGMAELTALLPADGAQLIATALDVAADRSRCAPEDVRTADQRRADALVQFAADSLHRLTPTSPLSSQQPADPSARPTPNTDQTSSSSEQSAGPTPTRAEAPTSASPTASRPDDTAASAPQSGTGVWQGRRPSVHVTVPLSTLLGLDNEPAELAGHGPIAAEVARRMAADPTATWRRLITDPRGRLIGYGRDVYRPPADLREFVVARDQTCRFPGCGRAARRCDLDHVRPWEEGGSTDAENLQCLCSRHHHLRHETEWRVSRADETGDTMWISPTGRVYVKPLDPLPTGPGDAQHESDDPPPF